MRAKKSSADSARLSDGETELMVRMISEQTCDTARLVRVHDADNVATALVALSAGQQVQLSGRKDDVIRPLEDIPFCHKVAVRDIEEGRPIVKYGENIGLATRQIQAGSLVHVHNMKSGRATLKE
jgi:altronate dehydratase small subunit